MLRETKKQDSNYAELYELIVPKTHILRKMDANLDFQFVNDLLKESYCEDFSRPAKEPELLFRLLFLQTLFNLSDERVIQEAQVNLAYKWFLKLNPEDKLPHSSLLCKFRKHRVGANIFERILEETIQVARKKKLIRSKAIIVDATHSHANAIQETPHQALLKASKNLRKAIHETKPTLIELLPQKPIPTGDYTADAKTQLHYLAQVGETVEKHVDMNDSKIMKALKKAKRMVDDERFLALNGIQSAIDPDVKFGWKSEDHRFFGYKSYISMTEDRIITGIIVASGEAADGNYLIDLIEKTTDNGIEVKEVLADTAYSSKESLAFMHEKDILPTIPLNPIVYNQRENTGFEYVKDAKMMRCPAGHLSFKKACQGRKNAKKNQAICYYFDVNTCKNCPFKEGCYKEGSKSKTYSVRILSETHQKAYEYQRTPGFTIRKAKRSQIESKNAEMKQPHGLKKSKYLGLLGMTKQSLITGIVVNLKRIIKLDEMQVLAS